MTDKVKILEHDTLVRDNKTTAILNTDLDSLTKYKMKREREREVRVLIDDVKTLKNEISEIKSILHQIAKR